MSTLTLSLGLLTFARGARADEAPPLAPPPTAPASAEPSTPPAAPPAPATSRAAPQPVENAQPDPDRTFYISLSPLHLVVSTVELTGEVRVHRKLGVAAIAGVGRPTVSGLSEPVTVWELGGQLVGYPIGHFDHGMQLGLEALYVGASATDNSTPVRVSASARGVSLGPVIGYKLATASGFSFNVQGGVAVVAVGADAEGAGTRAEARGSTVGPLLNLNVGWSF